MRRAGFETTAICILIGAGISFAQTAPGQKPSFEVASVKRGQPMSGLKREGERSLSISTGNFSARNATLGEMILTAYGIREYQLSGPDWLKSERYDVAAKSASPAANDEIRLMLQQLLAERFKLETHRDSRDVTVFAMVVGKNGPKLGKAKPESQSRIGISGPSMTFENYSMPKLADYLSRFSGGLPVVDATKIEGYYDFAVPLLDAPADNPGDFKRAVEVSARDGSLARTIAEGIGLRLETRKGPVEIVVVDHAEKLPVEN
jgi:uncharacterized protein (TIGR03435 family)